MFLSLLPTKNTKMDAKHSIFVKKKDITRNVYNECFIINKNHMDKNVKTHVYGEFSQIPKCWNSEITLLVKNTEHPYQTHVFWVLFTFLGTKKKWHYQKSVFGVFLSVLYLNIECFPSIFVFFEGKKFKNTQNIPFW